MKYRLLLIIVTVFCSHCQWNQHNIRWQYLGKSDRGSIFYYNAESLSHPAEGIVGVWVKVIPSETESIFATLKLLSEHGIVTMTKEALEYEHNAYSHIFYEVDCKRQTIIPACSEDYDKKGKILFACPDEKEMVEGMHKYYNLDLSISPKTIWADLFCRVCKKDVEPATDPEEKGRPEPVFPGGLLTSAGSRYHN